MNIEFEGEWFGRFGNNVISMINIIAFAQITFSKITFNITHDLLNIKQLKIDFSKNIKTNMQVTPEICFFMFGDIFSEHKSLIYNMHEQIAKKYIFPIIVPINLKNNVNYNNTLFIHIRGGDIFNQSPHSFYPQPPLIFYEKIIEENNYKNILLISEDRKNPCVNFLLSKYKNITFNTNDLLTDTHMLLNAEHLIASNSTFIYIIILLSKKIKKVYYNNFLPNLKIKNVNIITYSFNDYIKYGEWKNDQTQIKLMLEFPKEKIKIVNGKVTTKNIVEHLKNINYKSNDNLYDYYIIIIIIMLFFFIKYIIHKEHHFQLFCF